MNHYIDHTLLLANATTDQINTLCDEADDHQFFSVCVNPRFVEHCAQRLKASNVKICTVIGFPLGANTTAVKVFETQNAISLGADEIDMVVNVSDVLDAKWGEVEREISELQKLRARMVSALSTWQDMPDGTPDGHTICRLIEHWDDPSSSSCCEES